MSNKLWLCLLVAAVIAFYGANSYFSVPKKCACQILLTPPPQARLDAVENSIEDAKSLVFRIGLSGPDDVEQFRICYADRPKRGRIWESAGISAKGCKYENWYHVQSRGIRKTATEAVFAFDLAEAQSIPNVVTQADSRKKTSGQVHFDRGNNTCELALSDWNDATLKGQAECEAPVYYFDLWSHFPPTTELFYTRAFYWLHSNRNSHER